ncbi:DNA primase [Sphingomonas sp. Leaf412]|uniref:DNA primase n=1 Tax=Sphingomonas sp. Leaf412 TaxID=1736370 RepID=UPI0006F206AF|nr:DNA primase [Sphingomonas sp. Leaf412]KQT32655.1 DNA primase [Sphingomonas sp. Leaf412]
MSLTPAFLDELRARTSLSALVGKSVKLTKAGREHKGCCPFHDEKTPSFYVNDDKGFYHCFGCSAHGDAIRWMTEQRGLPFIDAVKELAAAAGMDMPALDRRAAEKAEKANGLHEAMAEAATWFAAQMQGLSGAEARALAERRGLTAATIRDFGIGFAPDARNRLKTALPDYTPAQLIEAGLLIQVEGKEPYDRFRGRLMIPIRDVRGRTIAFGGRVIGDGEPKYLNSPDTPLFDKGRTLYNLDRAAAPARKADRVLVVEGYMDVIALAQAGIAEVVAPLGTALTEHQLERLWRMVDVPTLCFDGDAAGQKAALRAAHRALPLLTPGKSLSFVTMPEGQDPDDVVRRGGAGAFEALARAPEALVDRLWKAELAAEPLVTPEQRAGLRARLRELANTIKDNEVRLEYVAAFNTRLWDFSHPERPSQSFRTFNKGGKGYVPYQPPSERVLAISKAGIDQVTIIPALIRGLIRYPDLLRPLAETLVRIPIASIRLRQVREVLLDAALHHDALETAHVLTILRQDALEPVVAKLEEVTLAFSFLAHKAEPEQARRDLALVAEKLDVGPAIDVEIEEARERYSADWNQPDFDEYVRLLKAKQRMDEVFMDALLPEEEPAA